PISSLVDEGADVEDREGTSLGGSEKICIVEDEDAVRELTSEILTEQGYEVYAFGTPREALESFHALRKKERPDLVLADVIMPGMNGVQMVSELRKKGKDLKVLLMSGYTDDALEEKGLGGTEYELLTKPFTIEELCFKIRKVLDEADL
ncbi:response regulator, partial [Gemmatimonadota bacterium]